MMNPDYRDAIVQNLKDAGCSAGIIENYEEEKEISCLDYLIYQIKK